MENNRFEDSFRSVFKEAEISPSEGVWTNVELSLEKTLGGQIKRNLLMFQLLAAASVVFACGIGALYFLESKPAETKDGIVRETHREQDTLLNRKEHHALSNEISAKKSIAPKSITSQTAMDNADKRLIPQKAPADHHVSNIRTADSKGSEASGDVTAESARKYTIEKRGVSSFARNTTPLPALPKPEKQAEPDAFMIMMARLKDEEKKYQDEDEKKSRENMWASLGFGAGSYKPNRQALNSNSSVTGESYSAGLNVAGKISNRFVLQGGVSYLLQNADFSSTTSTRGIATLNEFASVSLENYSNGNSARTPYVVNSSLQFVSIPLQAGYLIVDRAFGLQVNGGIATDLFINNTLSAENGDYDKVTQAAGKDSPYRTVNFSGLLGTEFSYRLADHYRISLNPGLRYSLNSIYKEEIAATITPVTFDVSLRFRYIFK